MLRKNTAFRDLQGDAFGDAFDGGSLEIYTGTQPTDPNDSPSGSILCTITLPSPAFGASSGGVIAKAGTWSDTAGDTGTAGWARFISSDTNKTFDVTVSDVAGGNNLLINDVDIVLSNTVTVTSLIVTIPES